MKVKCCDKHKKNCGMAGKYEKLSDAYCCPECPDLKARNEARREYDESLKKLPIPTCEHLDWNNEKDCQEEAEFICICCGSPTCREHKQKECPYGGMGYIEFES